MIRKTAPPTTQTHGWVYHSVVVVVVDSLVTVTLVLEPVLSCAQTSTCVKLSRNKSAIRCVKEVIECFMLVIFDK